MTQKYRKQKNKDKMKLVKQNEPMPSFIAHLREFVKLVVQEEMAGYLEKPKEEKDGWLTIEEVCTYIKVSKPTLWEMSNKGYLNKYYLDGKPRYKKSEVDSAFIKLESKRGGNHA